MTQRVLLISLFTTFVISIEAQYQSNINSDSLLKQHLEFIKELTESKLNNPDEYIAGKLYYPKGTSYSHPYYPDNGWKTGSVNYKGEQYPVSIMKYDVEKDVIVVLKTIGTLGYPISLDRNRIKEFCIGEHCFTFLDSIRTPGYCELIYNNKTSVWLKWIKEEVNSKGGNPKYKLIQRFVIRKDKKYYMIRKLKDYYNVFIDKEQDLKLYKKRNKLSFIKDKQGTIIKLTEQYDILTN